MFKVDLQRLFFKSVDTLLPYPVPQKFTYLGGVSFTFKIGNNPKQNL